MNLLIFSDVNYFDGLDGPILCDNCVRNQCHSLIDNYSTYYKIKFHQVHLNMVKTCCNYRLLPTSKDDSDIIHLCDHGHLTTEDNKKAQQKSFTWTAFIWIVLTDDNIIKEYDTFIWQFIPKTWRYWSVDVYF